MTSSWGAYYVGVYTMDCQTARLLKDFNSVPPPPKKVGTTHTHKSAIDKMIINAKDIEKKEKKYVTPICSTATKLKI